MGQLRRKLTAVINRDCFAPAQDCSQLSQWVKLPRSQDSTIVVLNHRDGEQSFEAASLANKRLPGLFKKAEGGLRSDTGGDLEA